MSTSFVTSSDGVRIAYDVSGDGMPLVLLHGGGLDRRSWRNVHYVERLRSDFKVITVDIRGNGESDKPIESAAYTTAHHCQDVLAVTEACGVERFALWGYSYGANIGRYLAAQSTQVSKFILGGVSFGPGAAGDFRQFILGFREHWRPILQAAEDGTLDIGSLSAEEQTALRQGDMPATLAQRSAMLEWKPIQPVDLLCPTLWLVGSRSETVMANIREYGESLRGSNVQVRVIDGLDHYQEFEVIEQVLPVVRAFLQA